MDTIISAIIGFIVLTVFVGGVIYGLVRTSRKQEFYYSHGVKLYMDEKAPIFLRLETFNDKGELIYVKRKVTSKIDKNFIFQAFEVLENEKQ